MHSDSNLLSLTLRECVCVCVGGVPQYPPPPSMGLQCFQEKILISGFELLTHLCLPIHFLHPIINNSIH